MLRCALNAGQRLQQQLACTQLCLRAGASSKQLDFSKNFSGAKMPAAGAAQLCHAKRRARGRRFVLHRIFVIEIASIFRGLAYWIMHFLLLDFFLQGTTHYAAIR